MYQRKSFTIIQCWFPSSLTTTRIDLQNFIQYLQITFNCYLKNFNIHNINTFLSIWTRSKTVYRARSHSKAIDEFSKFLFKSIFSPLYIFDLPFIYPFLLLFLYYSNVYFYSELMSHSNSSSYALIQANYASIYQSYSIDISSFTEDSMLFQMSRDVDIHWIESLYDAIAWNLLNYLIDDSRNSMYFPSIFNHYSLASLSNMNFNSCSFSSFIHLTLTLITSTPTVIIVLRVCVLIWWRIHSQSSYSPPSISPYWFPSICWFICSISSNSSRMFLTLLLMYSELPVNFEEQFYSYYQSFIKSGSFPSMNYSFKKIPASFYQQHQSAFQSFSIEEWSSQIKKYLSSTNLKLLHDFYQV